MGVCESFLMKIINNEEIKLVVYGWRGELLSCSILLLLVCAILFYSIQCILCCY